MISEALYLRRLAWDEAVRFRQSRVMVFLGQEPADEALALEVVDVVARASRDGERQFSIFFRGPRSHALAQRTYRVSHPELGEFAIFMTATGQSAESVDYEACFFHVD